MKNILQQKGPFDCLANNIFQFFRLQTIFHNFVHNSLDKFVVMACQNTSYVEYFLPIHEYKLVRQSERYYYTKNVYRNEQINFVVRVVHSLLCLELNILKGWETKSK